MKTPEEIKKGLECCARASEEACKHCPYCNDCDIFEACNLYRDALAYITKLEQHFANVGKMLPEWISVEDRLPEPSTYVLALTAPGALSVGENVIVADYIHPKREDHGVFVIAYTPYADQYILPVTHWMPIPEMPKEE